MRIFRKIFIILFIFGCGFITGIITQPPKNQNSSISYNTQAFFSPNGSVRNQIIKAINECKKTLDIAIFDLTATDILMALEEAKKRGVNIRIIADSRQAKGVHSAVKQLFEDGLKLKITNGKKGGIMHNKFAIFDDKLLITGSYNWTDNAEFRNYENAIFTTDLNLIKNFKAEFNNIWNSKPKTAN